MKVCKWSVSVSRVGTRTNGFSLTRCEICAARARDLSLSRILNVTRFAHGSDGGDSSESSERERLGELHAELPVPSELREQELPATSVESRPTSRVLEKSIFFDRVLCCVFAAFDTSELGRGFGTSERSTVGVKYCETVQNLHHPSYRSKRPDQFFNKCRGVRCCREGDEYSRLSL